MLQVAQATNYEDGIINALFSFPKDHPKILNHLKIEHFHQGTNRKIFAIFKALYNQHKPDMISNEAIIATLNEFLTEQNTNWNFWVDQFTREAPLPPDVDYYMGKILAAFNKRFMSEITYAAEKRLEKGQSADQVKSYLQKEIDRIGSDNLAGSPITADIIAADVISAIQDGNQRDSVGISTGFIDLDNLTLGLRGGDLFVIAGRPGMGKTTLAMNISLNVAHQSRTGLIFSLEMSKNRLGLRMVASETECNLYEISRGNVSDWNQINSISGQLCNLHIDFSTALTHGDIVSRIHEFVDTQAIDFVMIDYLQKLRFEKSERHDLAVGDATLAFKNVAKDLDIPVILLSQLSRANEKDGSKVREPRLSDLRDSGSIEQDADIVLMLHRPEVYSSGVSSNKATVLVRKNRDGDTGKFELTFRKNINRFENFIEGA